MFLSSSPQDGKFLLQEMPHALPKLSCAWWLFQPEQVAWHCGFPIKGLKVYLLNGTKLANAMEVL